MSEEPGVDAVPPEGSEEERIVAWARRTLGGDVVDLRRQPRWRPAWTFDVLRGDERLPIYFRGDRGLADHGVYTLEREMAVFRVLESEGIPVPHVYGFCDSPRGIVMERARGRANLATAESDAERESVLDHYVELLARMHRLDVNAFDSAGLSRPADSRSLALADLDLWEAAYRRAKARPEPLIEFGLGWLARNAPTQRDRVGFVCSDSGQFLFEGGRVTAVLDLELAFLGDPAADLAGLRTRDLSEPLGDLSRAIARYESLTGEPVDRAVVDYHTARFSLVTPLAVAALVARPPPGIDLVQYLCWYHVYGRVPVELMAKLSGVPLEEPDLPDDVAPTEAPPGDGPGSDFEDYRSDAAWRAAEHRRRSERFGPALEADDLAEVSEILGRRPRDGREAEAALEACVVDSGPERDPEVLRHLYRRSRRQEFLLAPVARELRGATIQDLDEPA